MATGDTIQGTIQSVDSTPLGSEIDPSSATASGTTVITVTDVVDFWQGSKVSIDGVLYAYSNVDDVNQQITLASPGLTAAVAVGDAVLLWDVGANAQAVVPEAVVLPQGSPAGDTIMAVLDSSVIPYLPIGPRDPTNAHDAENVVCEDRNGAWWVTSVGQRNVLVGATIETAPSGPRWVLSSPNGVNELLGYTGDADEAAPGSIYVDVQAGHDLRTYLTSPANSANGGAICFLWLSSTPTETFATLQSQNIYIGQGGSNSLQIGSSGVYVGAGSSPIANGLQFGTAALPAIAAGAATGITVTFTAAYSVSSPTPVVVASQNAGSGLSIATTLNKNLAGTFYISAGFTIRNLGSSNAPAGTLSWIAIG